MSVLLMLLLMLRLSEYVVKIYVDHLLHGAYVDS